jgi:hypothetical protein
VVGAITIPVFVAVVSVIAGGAPIVTSNCLFMMPQGRPQAGPNETRETIEWPVHIRGLGMFDCGSTIPAGLVDCLDGS